MKKILLMLPVIFTLPVFGQLYERSARNMGIQAGYDYTSSHTSKKGFMPGETGQAFRIGYMRTFGDFIYPGIIFNYRKNLILLGTDSAGTKSTVEVRTPSIQIPLLLQIPFVSIPLGKSKNRECTYLNTNFRVGPEFSYNLKSRSVVAFASSHEFALQSAFGFSVSKSGGTHRRMAWDIQWHLVWRKSFNHFGTQDGFAGSKKYYNNYVGVTVTVIRYATSKFF